MIRAIVISAVFSVWASIATALPTPGIYIAGDQQYDQLGAAVDQNHNQMVIGAPSAFVVADGDGFVQALSKTFGAWGPQGVTGGIFGRFEAGFPTDHDYLGHAVDVDRNLLGEFVAVLGASGSDSIVQDNTGAAYVLVNSGGSWTQVHRLDPFDVDNDEPTPQHDFFAQRGVDPIGGQFGRAVAVHGDLIAIGIPYASARPGTGMDMLQEAGAVAIYHRNGGSWELEAVLSRASSDTCATDIHQQDYFGYSVAISGQYLAVGVPLADDPHMTDDGVCWLPGGCVGSDIFPKDTCDLLGGTWLPGQSCDTTDNPVAGIGACCYLEASSCTWHAIDTIIEIDCLTNYGGTWIPGQQADDITCPIIDNSPLNDNIGEVHIFRRDSASNWEHYVTLRPPIHVLPADPDYRLVDSWFGLSVAMSGSTLAVGQPGYLRPDNATPEQPGGRGMAWAFERTGGSDPWTLLTALDPNLPVGIDLLAPLEDGYNYGWSVDTSSCHIAVGAPGGDFNSTSYAGSAYVWDHIGLGVWSGTTTTDTNPVCYLAPFFSPDSGDRWGHDVSVTVHDFAMGGPRNTHDVLIPGVYVGGIETWDTPCNCDTPNGPEDDCDGDGCSDTWQILIDPTLDLAGNIGGDCHDVDPNGWPEGDGVLDACQMGYGVGSFFTPNGNLYQVVLDPNTTFTNAMADPRLDTSGVDLASLSTWLEGYYVAVAAGWNGPLWLGGQQLSTTGADDEGWAWNSGEVWFWTNWEEGPPQQPDNGGPLTDALLASGNNVPWTWSDEVTDSIMADGYLMEYDSDCNRNMVLDVWEIREALNNSGLVLDCEDDCVLDACQIANGTRLDCNGNGIPDQCDLKDGTSEDCNTNNVPDECDVATGGASEDCNANGIPDECEFVTCPVVVINEVLVKPNSDVNGDGTIHPVQDQYVEIVNSTSTAIPLGGWEVRVDGLPWHVFAGGTVIEANCAILVFGGGVPNPVIFPPNITLFTALNGAFLALPIPGPGLTTVMELWDGEDIPNRHDVVLWDDEANTSGTSVTRCPDVVGQALPLIVHDSCTSLDRSPGLLVDGSFFLCSTDDSDQDDIPDIDDNCPDVYNPDQADCDGNGIGDACDPFTDCNINLIPDVCDIADGTSEDCNTNDVPDECDIANDTSEDCNSNGIPDECEVDCNSNGIPDDCDITDGTSEDCNLNGIPDECDEDCNGNDIPDDCDIADGTSEDCNSNGIPDDCDIADLLMCRRRYRSHQGCRCYCNHLRTHLERR